MVEKIFSMTLYYNYSFSVYAIPVFWVGIITLILGIYIFDARQRNMFGFKFFVTSLFTALWLISIGLAYCSREKTIAILWVRLAMVGVALIPFTQFLFNAEIAKHTKKAKSYKFLLVGSLIFSVLFSLLSLNTDLFVKDVKQYFWGFYPIFGPVGVVFAVFFVSLGAITLQSLYVGYRAAISSREKIRVKLMLMAVNIGYLASIDFVAGFGVSLYPFGYLPITIMILIWVYVSFRYQFSDITPQSAARETLAAMQSALMVTDTDGRIQLINGRASLLLELSENDLINKDVIKLLGIPAEYKDIDNLNRKSVYDTEIDIVSKSQKAIPVSLSISVIKDTKECPIGIVYILLDISRRKHAEQQLLIEKTKAESTRDRLQQTINAISVTISSVEREKEDSLLNFIPPVNPNLPNCWDIKGCNFERCPSYGVKNHRCWQIAGTYCGGMVQGTFAQKIDDCKECSVYMMATPDQMSNVQETFNNIMKILSISQKKLIKANLDAKEADRAKSSFLANMSHEIRTPLNGIIGMVEICLGTGLTAEQQEYLELAYSEATSMLNLINDILDFSKIEAGRLDMEEIPFNLKYLIDDITNSFRLLAAQKGVAIFASLTDEIPVGLLGDPGRLRQIFVNLISNSLKFTPEGGKIDINGKLVKTDDSAVTLQFSVSDNGIGIPPENQEHIFESFTQADGSTTRKFGGTGLGTSISKQLSEAMGGDITLESDGKSGTTFTFTVVLRKQELAINQKADKVELDDLSVLVIDDNQVYRDELREDLLSYGCLVTCATNCKEALILLGDKSDARVDFDLIVINLQMTMMNGFDCAATVRKIENWKAVPIIAFVSVGTRGDGRKCIDVGINAYLTRPISREGLRQIIEMVFAGGQELFTKHHLAEDAELNEKKKDLRVLLVEDYPTNQKVALRHLENAGFLVDLAENGKQAVEACESEHYDVILMDIQMPVMDGYEATATIRKIDKSRQSVSIAQNNEGDSVPIIAMTAHAMRGYREKCLDAGMDDFITKPLRRNELLAIVNKWVNSQPEPEEESAAMINIRQSVNQSESAEMVMNFEKAVEEFEGDKEFLVEVLSGFLENISKQLGTIQQAINNNDAETVRREAHSIKGGAANLTANDLSQVAFELENIGRSGELAAALDTLGKLEAEYGKLNNFAQDIA